ncbi:MAG: hypothetical protein U9R69_07760 [Thermodesulfobacteriota bacterium]|nr:hypothetical protein [Thermodesulfobacteriota bacterium]
MNLLIRFAQVMFKPKQDNVSRNENLSESVVQKQQSRAFIDFEVQIFIDSNRGKKDLDFD